MRTLISALLLAGCSSLASAEILTAQAGGFTVVSTTVVNADKAIVWQMAIDDVASWWNPDHTVSGDASRLSITAVTGGCFCEDFGAGAGVVHLAVTMVNPGVILRLTGGLGPLGLMGVNGNMTWEFDATEAGTRVTFTYAVGGYHEDGLDTLAAPVDAVLGEALLRLKARAETPATESAEID